MRDSLLISPKAAARLVVTMPPEPSRLRQALEVDIASSYLALTETTDAFQHLALEANGRLTIMIPYIDRIGAAWAADLFEITPAMERILILRDARQLANCGPETQRLQTVTTRLLDYGQGELEETFHAKIVLADGTAAYVGSANLLARSKSTNLECGMLIEGPAVQAVRVLVDAVIRTSSQI